MKRIILVMLAFLMLISCDSDEIIPESNKCLITKFNIITRGNKYSYENEFIYNSNKQIIKYINHEDYYQRRQTYEIEYSNKLPSKIIVSEYKYYLITYSKGVLSQIVKVSKTVQDYEERYVYNFTYSNGKPKKIESYYEDDPNYENTIEMFEYIDGNVSKVTKTTITSSGNIYRYETGYYDYDNNPNPFNNVNVPFLDLLPNIYSKNNAESFSHNGYVNGERVSYLHSNRLFEYNNEGLPKYAEYNCE